MLGYSPEPIRTRWSEASGGEAGADYARRIAARQQQAAAAGADAHGEARFVHELAVRQLGRPAARVLDAGCGVGRVAIALHEMGHPVLGVDADLSMLRVAADLAPKIPFWLADLAELDVPQAAIAGGFEVVVMAGNVVPYLAEDTLDEVLRELARVTKRGGYVVAGFGIHPSDLPAGLPVTSVQQYEDAARAAGWEPVERYAGWDRESFGADSTYVVCVHRLRTPPGPREVPENGTGETGETDAGILPAGRIRSRAATAAPGIASGAGSDVAPGAGPEGAGADATERGGWRRLFRHT